MVMKEEELKFIQNTLKEVEYFIKDLRLYLNTSNKITENKNEKE